MAGHVPFQVGTEFGSFSEFEDELTKYEESVKSVFSVSSSRRLKVGPNLTEEDCEKLKYEFIRYECLFYGQPRKTLRDDEERQRQTKSYRSGCKSYFTVGIHQNGNTSVLRIRNISGNHNHERNDTIFKSLPKRRRLTIKEAAPYLKHVMNVKPNMQLVQADITNTSANHGVVKRADLYNFKYKNQHWIGDSDLEKMFNEMKNINGATIKAFHNSSNELQAVYFQDQRMKEFFDAFPELLMFDGTFSLNDRRMPLIVLLVVDGNGESQIAGFFIVKSENAAALNYLFTHFKTENPSWEKVEVILTDKAMANRNAIETQFPGVAHHLCIFHVAQIFDREITVLKRNITKEEREICVYILNQMIYAQDEQRYNQLYNDLENTECESNFLSSIFYYYI